MRHMIDMLLTVKTGIYMNNDCFRKSTLKFVFGSISMLLSGWMLGSGIGELLNHKSIGIKIGIGMALFIIGIISFKIYLIDEGFKRKKNLYKSI